MLLVSRWRTADGRVDGSSPGQAQALQCIEIEAADGRSSRRAWVLTARNEANELPRN